MGVGEMKESTLPKLVEERDRGNGLSSESMGCVEGGREGEAPGVVVGGKKRTGRSPSLLSKGSQESWTHFPAVPHPGKMVPAAERVEARGLGRWGGGTTANQAHRQHGCFCRSRRR